MHTCRFCAEREAEHAETAWCAVCQAELDEFFGRFYPAQDAFADVIAPSLWGLGLLLVAAAGFAAVFAK